MAFTLPLSHVLRQGKNLQKCYIFLSQNTRKLSSVKKNLVKANRSTVHWSDLEKTIPCPFCKEEFRVVDALNFHIGSHHSAKISEALRQNPIDTYSRILTNKNVKRYGELFVVVFVFWSCIYYFRLSATELRYPEGLVIQLEGDQKGNWYSFTHSVGGGPLKALRLFQQMSVEDAAKRGMEIIQIQVLENVVDKDHECNSKNGEIQLFVKGWKLFWRNSIFS